MGQQLTVFVGCRGMASPDLLVQGNPYHSITCRKDRGILKDVHQPLHQFRIAIDGKEHQSGGHQVHHDDRTAQRVPRFTTPDGVRQQRRNHQGQGDPIIELDQHDIRVKHRPGQGTAKWVPTDSSGRGAGDQ